MGFAGLVSLAHAAFFGLAAYLLVGLSNRFALTLIFATLPLCMIGAALAALIVGWLSLRASGVYFIMVTLAFTQMLFYLFNDAPGLGGSDGLYLAERPLSDPRAAYLFIWVALVLVFLLLSRMLRSPFGHALVGIRSNEPRMRSLGSTCCHLKRKRMKSAGLTGSISARSRSTV